MQVSRRGVRSRKIGIKTATLTFRYKQAWRKKISLVQGKSLVRAAPISQNSKVRTKMQVVLIRPAAVALSLQCDRCTGNRHRDSNKLCSATRKRPTPFVDENVWYNIHTGARVMRAHTENETFIGRDTFGTAVLLRI